MNAHAMLNIWTDDMMWKYMIPLCRLRGRGGAGNLAHDHRKEDGRARDQWAGAKDSTDRQDQQYSHAGSAVQSGRGSAVPVELPKGGHPEERRSDDCEELEEYAPPVEVQDEVSTTNAVQG